MANPLISCAVCRYSKNPAREPSYGPGALIGPARLLLLAIAVIAAPLHAHAGCWTVSDFKGYSARGADNYEISRDGFTGQSFQIVIDQKKGTVGPSDLSCFRTAELSLACIDEQKPGKTTLETWSVSPSTGKAFHTKTISGYGPFDGANLFVGKIVGGCPGPR